MKRFYVAPESIVNGEALVEGAEAQHLTRVLRLGPGAAVEIIDGQGRAYLGEIQRISAKQVWVKILSGETPSLSDSDPKEAPLTVVLAQGIPKGDKMELVLQKGTELGAARFIPLQTARTIVQLTGKRRTEKQQRWQRIVQEAVKQCQRTRIPLVDLPSNLEDAYARVPPGALGLIPWEAEVSQSLQDVLQSWAAEPPKEVWIFIGPEGGFTTAEIQGAQAKGIIPVSLGPRILRTETAGLAVLSILLYTWGDLGRK